MKRILPLALAALILFGCNKEISPTTNDVNEDSIKLVNKSWYWGGKADPQFLTLVFKPNDTAFMIRCYWALPPYKYSTDTLPWHMVAKDTLSLFGVHIKIFTLNDSVLVTNNWVIGGLTDTIKQTFTTY